MPRIPDNFYHRILSLFAALISGLFVGLSIMNYWAQPKDIALYTSEKYLESVWEQDRLDLHDLNEVFDAVWQQLPSTIHVYPTENYYYYKFFHGGYEIAGNIRFDIVDRDKGLLDFAYFSTIDLPQNPEDLDELTDHHQFGPKDGLQLRKKGPLEYSVSYKGKTVTAFLNDVSQEKPSPEKLLDTEMFIMRTVDESGFTFLLLYDEKSNQFRFVLDDTAPLPDVLEDKGDGLFMGRRSSFAFYDDAERGRKILFGIAADNIRRNGYFDGPFDQLADNFIHDDSFKVLLEKAYPYVAGRVNRFGMFLDQADDTTGSRIALSPYIEYGEFSEVQSFMDYCSKETDRIACLTYDSQKDIPTD